MKFYCKPPVCRRGECAEFIFWLRGLAIILSSIVGIHAAITHPEYDLAEYSDALMIVRYKGAGGHVTIPQAFDGRPPTHIGHAAFNSFPGLTDIVAISIPASITNIDGAAFQYCHGLTTFNVDPANPKYSTYDGTIVDKTKTKLLHYPPGRPLSYVTPPTISEIGPGAFTSAIVPEITIGDSIVTVGDQAFVECQNLTKATFSDNLQSIGAGLFRSCTNLTDVHLPQNLSSMGSAMFANCSNLVQIALPRSLNTVPASTFYNCGKLRDVILPSAFASIGDSAFLNCISLSDIAFPDSLRLIGMDAFRGSGLTNIDISQHATSIGTHAFAECQSLEAINVNALNSAYSSFEGVLFDKSRAILLQYPAGKKGDYTVPSGVRNVGVFGAAPDFVFRGNTNLVRLTVPASVTSIDWVALYGVPNLASITVSPANSSYSSVDGVLFNLSKTTLLTFPVAKEGSYAIPHGVRNLFNGSFSEARKLTQLTIPSTVANIEQQVFGFNYQLTNIIVDAFNEAFTSVGGVLFSRDLKALVLYSNARGGAYSIPEGVTVVRPRSFSGNSQMASVKFASTVQAIGEWAFLGCSNLTSVTFPSSITQIGSRAFASCPNLHSLYFLGDEPSADNVFEVTATAYYLFGKARWELYPGYTSFGGTVKRLWLPDADLDADSVTNDHEKQAGTNPKLSSSRLQIEDSPRPLELSESDTLPVPPDQMPLYFQAVPGRTYEVQSTSALGTDWTTLQTYTAAKTQKRALVPRPVTASIYRVRVLPD